MAADVTVNSMDKIVKVSPATAGAGLHSPEAERVAQHEATKYVASLVDGCMGIVELFEGGGPPSPSVVPPPPRLSRPTSGNRCSPEPPESLNFACGATEPLAPRQDTRAGTTAELLRLRPQPIHVEELDTARASHVDTAAIRPPLSAPPAYRRPVIAMPEPQRSRSSSKSQGAAITSGFCQPVPQHTGVARDTKLQALRDGRPTLEGKRGGSESARLRRLLDVRHRVKSQPRRSSCAKEQRAATPQPRTNHPAVGSQSPVRAQHYRAFSDQAMATIKEPGTPRARRSAVIPSHRVARWRNEVKGPICHIPPPAWPQGSVGSTKKSSLFSRMKNVPRSPTAENLEDPDEHEETYDRQNLENSPKLGLMAEMQARFGDIIGKKELTGKEDIMDMYNMASTLKMSVDDVLLVKSVFSKFDKDGSGSLEIEEFEAAVLELLKKQTSDADNVSTDRAKSISGWCFWEANADGDGKIEFVEFLKWYSSNGFNEELLLSDNERWIRKIAKQYELTPDYVESIKRCFDHCDKDNSGEIEREEFQEVLYKLLKVPQNLELPPTRLSYFWSQIDSDNSGKAVFEEFLQWYTRYFTKGERNQAPFEDFYRQVRRIGAKYLDPPAFASKDPASPSHASKPVS